MNPHRALMFARVALLAIPLVACSSAEPPAPAPTQSTAAPASEQHQDLKRAIQEPLDKAQAATDQIQQQQVALKKQMDEGEH